MYCPNCGKDVEDNQKFCNHCGVKLSVDSVEEETDNSNNIIFISVSIVLALIIVGFLIFNFVSKYGFNIVKLPQPVDINPSVNVSKPVENLEESSEKFAEESPAVTLAKIDRYQARYWNIIKRNDVLLQVSYNDESKADEVELNKLFKEVKSKIDSNNPYLQKYIAIEKKYENKSGNTTDEVNHIAYDYYWEVDGLLNEVYQAVKRKISTEDFKPLIQSELRWLKEVEAYKKVYDVQDYGTIRTYMSYRYEINMRNFRTLLLMLYF